MESARKRKAEAWLEAQKEMTFARTGDHAKVAELEEDLKEMIRWSDLIEEGRRKRMRKELRKKRLVSFVSDM